MPHAATSTFGHDISGDTFFDRPIEDDEPVRAPGLMAMVRRNHKQVRRAYVAAIGAGVALFVVASVTSPLAGADVAHKSPALPVATDTVPPDSPLSAVPSTGAAPAQQETLKRKPTHVKEKAPVTHGVISGLASNGIPKVALNAYRVAAARMANVEPSCGIDWALLAGIGREESDHGRFAGATLRSDGVSTPPIIGPALDGVHWDYIPAPGNGQALDGDAKFAHALGPMQFIPSTWASYGADATGDGKADIFNINDAALGSARYLCAAGGDLRTHAGQVAGVLTYNHSDQYLAQVLALADAYRRGVPVTGIPVGNTSGKLPKVADTGYIPPANPAPPTAADKDKKAHAKHKKTKATSGSGAAAGAKGGGSSGSGTKSAKPTSGGGGGGGGAGGGAGGGKSTPAGSKSTTPKPGPSSTKPGSSPSPSPAKTCNVLEKLLHTNGC